MPTPNLQVFGNGMSMIAKTGAIAISRFTPSMPLPFEKNVPLKNNNGKIRMGWIKK
jgi:hypothetical protein